jgi:hypothetical protein
VLDVVGQCLQQTIPQGISRSSYPDRRQWKPTRVRRLESCRQIGDSLDRHSRSPSRYKRYAQTSGDQIDNRLLFVGHLNNAWFASGCLEQFDRGCGSCLWQLTCLLGRIDHAIQRARSVFLYFLVIFGGYICYACCASAHSLDPFKDQRCGHLRIILTSNNPSFAEPHVDPIQHPE